jgi:hypothetical protein
MRPARFLSTLALLALLLSTIAIQTASPPRVASAASDCTTFPETGHTVCGRFLQYWNEHGGLAQQGYPITDAVGETSDLDGQLRTVQYFERSEFEYHPENAAPNDVLLSLLGNFRYKAKYPSGAPEQMASTDNALTFSETGKTIGGSFRAYWEQNGGLAQQGFPISDEFTEVSDLNGQSYTVQYFERAVFELHPENPATSSVLLSQLGTFLYQQKSSAGGWAAPPLPVPPALSNAPAAPPPPSAVPVPPTATEVTRSQPIPTQPPAPPAPAAGTVVIASIYYDGQEYRSEGDEYAVVQNTGSSPVNMQGYRLNAGDNGQNFVFPSFTLDAGADVRVYTNRDVPGSFSFNYGRAIWNNKDDCGYLYDAAGAQISTYCY